MGLLQRKRDAHNGSAVVLEYSLSKMAVGTACLVTGAAMSFAAVTTLASIERARNMPDPKAPTVASVRAELAATKSRLELQLREEKAVSQKSQACAGGLQTKRLDELKALRDQVAAFPPFKTDTYKQPFDKLKATITEFSEASKLDYPAPANVQDCAYGVKPRD